MNRTVSTLIIAAAATLALTVGASARESRCKGEITAIGSASITKAGAEKSAETNWRRTVVARYGEFMSDFAKAEDATKQCGKTLLGLTRCELRARPCPAAETTPSGAPTCSGMASPKAKCEDDILAVQTAISKKQPQCWVGEVDGVEGKDTVKAIKCVQKALKLPTTGELDNATLDALGVKL